MSLINLFKDAANLFATKGRRKLRELEKIQDKTFKIQEVLAASDKAMTEALISAKEELGVANQEVKELSNKLEKVSDYLIQSLDATDEDAENDQRRLASEVQTLEVELEEATIQAKYLQTQVEDTQARRNSLADDTLEAERILRTSAARYRTAERLLKANEGVLSADVFKEIDDIKRESIRLQQRNIAIADVSNTDRKKDVKDIINRRRNTSNTPQELAARIKEQRLLKG